MGVHGSFPSDNAEQGVAMPRTYPVSLVLEGQSVLVVGGGAVATRKVEGLLPYDVSVTIVAPALTDALRALADAGRCAWRAKTYDAEDLHGADIVFVATDDESVNAQAYRDASGRHLMINVADRPELCTFFLPSVLRRGRLSIAVSTEGASPLTARRLRNDLEERIPASFEAYLDLLCAWRPRVIAALPDEADRYRFWQRATDGCVQRLIDVGKLHAADELLDGILVELSRSAARS